MYFHAKLYRFRQKQVCKHEDVQPSALPTAEAQPGHRQRFIKHPRSGLLETLSPGNPQASRMLEQVSPLRRGEQTS